MGGWLGCHSSAVDCRALAGISFIRAARFYFLSTPPFFDKSKTDEIVLDMTLKKLLGESERETRPDTCDVCAEFVCGCGVGLSCVS